MVTLSKRRPRPGQGLAKAMIADAKQAADQEAQITLGADKGYDAAEFIEALMQMNVVPHVAQSKNNRRSAVPGAIAQSEVTPFRRKSANSSNRGLVGPSLGGRFGK